MHAGREANVKAFEKLHVFFDFYVAQRCPESVELCKSSAVTGTALSQTERCPAPGRINLTYSSLEPQTILYSTACNENILYYFDKHTYCSTI